MLDALLVCVIGCPDCRRVQVVNASVDRVRCRGCGVSFQLAARVKFFVGEDAMEARRVASRVTLELQGVSAPVSAEASAAMEQDRSRSWQDVVASLERHVEFGLAEVDLELLRSRVTWSAARVVEALRQANRVYEPRPGRFRWLRS